MIGLREAMLLGGSTTGTSPTTWNPLDKGTVIILTNGNLTATPGGGSGYGLVRSTTSYTTGKLYYEALCVSTGSSPFAMVGPCKSTVALTTYPGGDANGWGYYQQTGQKYNNAVASTFGASYAVGDVIGVAVDIAAGMVWFAKNNAWQASGNPASGTSPAFTGLTGPLFAALGLYGSNGGQFTGRFRTADLTYAPPSGFSAWG